MFTFYVLRCGTTYSVMVKPVNFDYKRTSCQTVLLTCDGGTAFSVDRGTSPKGGAILYCDHVTFIMCVLEGNLANNFWR